MSNNFSLSSQHTYDSYVFTLTDVNGAARILTGALWCYAEMQPQVGGAYAAINGTCAITNAGTGQVTVNFAAADVATPGVFLFKILANFGSVIKSYEATATILP